ncbi:DUF6653 family protein [Pseudooceanicola batsensis]|uniref:DUF6653 family protein n=1 Tax=Pseudooceanicola batsensis TaxID=314255 RepID=UPI0011D20DD7|nr:DUF6653 family protein [Pseudooceanicola batsensis]
MKVTAAMVRCAGLDAAPRERRAHARSVCPRSTIVPLFMRAVRSRVWPGWWALVPVVLVVVRTRMNRHLFPPPATTRSWVARGACAGVSG